MIKYVVVGGYTKGDGKEKYVSPVQLIKLYGVKPEECLRFGSMDAMKAPGFSTEYLHSLVWLTPREDGDYAVR